MEAIGDITASAEVSRVEVEGEDFDSRIQGGVLVSLISFSLDFFLDFYLGFKFKSLLFRVETSCHVLRLFDLGKGLFLISICLIWMDIGRWYWRVPLCVVHCHATFSLRAGTLCPLLNFESL